jgi:multiple sugar transport system substrate-binding protein
VSLTRYTTRRRLLEGTAALGAATLILPGKAPAQGGAKPLQGVTLNVSTFSSPFPTILKDLLPQFEQATGARVNFDTPSFPVYNQRADLELSTGGSAYDVLNVTFIYSSRWIGAGWFTPLDDYIGDPNRTPADWDVADFLPGLRAPETGKDGKLYGIPWTVDTYIAGASRHDLIKAAGHDLPDTFEQIPQVLQAVHRKEGAAGFVTENHYGWTFVPYLQGFGGGVFRDPPDDLTPILDSPEAAEAAEFFATLLRDFGPDGVLSYSSDQAVLAMKAGRANYSTNGQTYIVQVADAATSKTAKTAAFGIVPKGPAGRFPGVAVHALGIPATSRNKDAAWQFISWAMSKETTRKALVEKGYSSPTRRTLIETPEFKQRMTLNGYDVADTILQSIDLAARTGHMKYRTVHVYPQVDKQLDKAIELIASGQLSAREAMAKAQAGSIADLKRAGVRV